MLAVGMALVRDMPWSHTFWAGVIGLVTAAATTLAARAVCGGLAPRRRGTADPCVAGSRVGVLGGASSLLISADGPRLLDVAPVAPQARPEVELGIQKLETLLESSERLDWFYVSPAAEFGAWVPSTETGQYRISDDVLLRDPDGHSEISAADLAIAVVDEIEHPTHRRRRFHVAH